MNSQHKKSEYIKLKELKIDQTLNSMVEKNPMNTTPTNIKILNQSSLSLIMKNSINNNTKKKKNRVDEYLKLWINKNK